MHTSHPVSLLVAALVMLRQPCARNQACVFHANLTTDSTANWTVIPRQSGH